MEAEWLWRWRTEGRGSDRWCRVLGNGAGAMNESDKMIFDVRLFVDDCISGPPPHAVRAIFSQASKSGSSGYAAGYTSLYPLPSPPLLQGVTKTTTSQASTSISSTGTSSTSTKFPRSSLRIIFWFSTFVVPRSNL